MDEDSIDGSYSPYRMPTEEGLAEDTANGNVLKEVATHSVTNSVSEHYVIKHNSVE